MARAEDDFTSTVEGAEAFERFHGQHYSQDTGPDLSDLYEQEEEDLVEPSELLQPYEVLGGDPDEQ